MHIHIKYEVSIFNSVAKRDANTNDDTDANNYAQWTNHDDIHLVLYQMSQKDQRSKSKRSNLKVVWSLMTLA